MDAENKFNEDESLKIENEFLKMKLMLESGAEFGGMDADQTIPPEVENAFLKNILEFEKQCEGLPQIKVFDRIGRPTHFKPPAEIADEDIDAAWEDLYDYLGQHGISLDACSPNIKSRELYRFAVEELFEEKIDDINIPGMMTGFIYDEFYPDHVYDNSVMATERCMEVILASETMEWMFDFKQEGLCLNTHSSLTREEFRNIVNRFKLAYDVIVVSSLICDSCNIAGMDCQVTGTYKAEGKINVETYPLSGKWEVELERDQELGYWHIGKVNIEGIQF